VIDGAVGDRISARAPSVSGGQRLQLVSRSFGRRSFPRITMLSSRVRLPELPNGRKAMLFLFFGIILGVEFNVLVGVPVARFLFTLHDIQRRMDDQQALSLSRGVILSTSPYFSGRYFCKRNLIAFLSILRTVSGIGCPA
jgi:hypothetical protein